MIQFRLYDILHRDLAGRNLLVFLFHAGDRKQVLGKVSYYGLSLLVQRGQGRNSGAEMATWGGERGPGAVGGRREEHHPAAGLSAASRRFPAPLVNIRILDVAAVRCPFGAAGGLVRHLRN